MRNPITAVLLAAALLSTAPAAARAADSAAERLRPVRLLVVEGVQADSVMGGEFMRGFNETLAETRLALERRDGGGKWIAAGSRTSCFQFIDDPEARDVWTLQVVVRVPPPFTANRRNRYTNKMERHVDPSLRVSRGMTAALIVMSPEAINSGARVMPEPVAFAFPQELAPASVLGNAPGGFQYPWRRAGRAAALLALDLLHHRSGDFTESVRCDLSPAVRVETGP